MRASDLKIDELTDQQIIELALGDDELYAELALSVVSEGKVVPFIYNEPQRIIDETCRHEILTKGRVRIIGLKARQMGFSTLVQGRGFMRTTTRENYKMEVISHEDKSAEHLLGMSQLFLQELPGQFKPMVRFQPKTSLYFANEDKKDHNNPGLRSGITVTSAKNTKGGRSKTPHFLHFSEVAFYPGDAKKLVDGYLQGVPDRMETEVFLESTANGNEGYFYELWKASIAGRTGWTPLFIPWWQMGTYRLKPGSKLVYDKEEDRLRERFKLDDEQLAWRRYALRNKCSNDLLLFKQEYPCDWMEAFQSSGSKFFPILQLQALFDKEEAVERAKAPRRGTVERDERGKPVWIDDPQGWCILHKEPVEGMSYIATVDSSEGTEDEDHDPSGILVTTCPTDAGKMEEEVFEYNGYLDPDQLADFAMLLGEWYNWAFLMHEDNHHGITVSQSLKRENYPSVYEREVFDEITQDINTKIGFRTDAKTKPQILNLLKADLREGTYVPRTTAAIEELMAFKKSKVVHKGGLYSGNAQAGAHDERVIIRAMNRLAAQVAPRTAPGKEFKYQKAAANYSRR